MLYTKDQLETILNDSKILKSRIIVTVPGNPGTMIGTDDSISYIKTVPYNSSDSNIWNVNKDPLIYTNSIPVLLDMMESGYICNNEVSVSSELFLNLKYIKIINGYHYYLNAERLPFIHYSNLHTNSEFMRIISLPASQGSTDWVIDENYIISLYSGLINANKTDLVDLFIYDMNDNTFVAKFIVTKGKKGTISIYMRCTKV